MVSFSSSCQKTCVRKCHLLLPWFCHKWIQMDIQHWHLHIYGSHVHVPLPTVVCVFLLTVSNHGEPDLIFSIHH